MKDILTLTTDRFTQIRSLGEKTLEQLSEADLHWSPDEESNSIAVIVQHLAGNMISRFTDFLTTDGEKENRNRDGEFVEHGMGSQELRERWDAGWECLFAAMRPLTEADLNREVFIRGESHTVMEALLRQLSHFAYHVGQIVYIGKMRQGSAWKTLSIARGASQQFNTALSQSQNKK